MNTPFKIFFWPTVVLAFLSLGTSFLIGVIPAIIIFVTTIAGRYVFAKGMSKIVDGNFGSL